MSRLEKGTEIDNRFVVTELLGRGANGELWKATDKEAKRDVAIKVLKNPREDEKRRLLQEAQNWGKLEHENVLRLYDVQSAKGILIMECADGGSLEHMLRQAALRSNSMSPAPPCSLDEAARIFRDILRGLAFAHEKEILHRDLKPGNILLSRYGTAKISDFGMARDESDGARPGSPGTNHTSRSGTPEYMSPEQARGEDIDRQSDIFSAGIIAYQLFTGKHPFLHPSLLLTPREIIGDDNMTCGAVNDERPDVPEKIAEIIDRMLAKKKEKRFKSVRDILAELEDETATLSCDKCGSSNPVLNRFCGQCGAPIAVEAPAAAEAEGPPTAEALVNEGFELARTGDWVRAIRRYREAIDTDADCEKAYANLGYAYNHLGLYEEALECLTKGMELGGHPALYSYRAFSYRNMRRYREALDDLSQALEDRPHDTRLLKEQAICLLEEGDVEQAYSAVLLGLRYDPANPPLVHLRERIEQTSPEIRSLLGRGRP